MNLFDRILARRFLRIARQAHIDSGMVLPPVPFDSRHPYLGIEALMGHILTALSDISDDRAERQRIFYEGMDIAMVRFLGGRLITGIFAKIMDHWPVMGARMMNWLTPIAFQWLVGPIENRGALSSYIPCCRFRKALGKQACIDLCKHPTEHFFIRRLHLSLGLKPSCHGCSCTVKYSDTRFNLRNTL